MNVWTRCCPVCDRRLEKRRPYEFFACANCGWQEKTNDMIDKERSMKILGWALVVGLLVSGCAGAKGDLLAITRTDAEAALAIAGAANDPAGVACATAILMTLPENAVANVTPQGALSAFMLVRETRRKIDGGVSETLHNACAPLILDAEKTLAKLGLMAVPGGGALGGLLK